jgi:subtilase family serine protease
MKAKLCQLFGGVLVLFQIFAASSAAELKVLSGHVPDAVFQLKLQPVGRPPAAELLHLSIALPLHNRAALTTLIQQIYSPDSANFHRYLTPGQFTEQFGPSVQEYESVLDFVQSNRLALETTFGNRALVAVSGSVADIEAAFKITLRTYRQPTENREFYAPDVEPQVDVRLPITEINGLDNYILPHPGNHGIRPPSQVSGGGSGPGGFWGYDFRNAYVPNAGTLTGLGQVVGLFELDGYYPSDIAAYEAMTGLPNLVPTLVKVGTFNGVPSTNFNSVGEVSLDIESAIAMAPGMSSLRVYEGNNTASILTQIAVEDIATQISSSWFFGRASTNDTELLEMAAQGQSFFQCSGDNLAYANGINNGPNSGPPADDPYLTSVGGTMLTTASDKSWLQETNWNNENGVNGSGGGISTVYSIPIWQQGVNMSANGGSTSFRNIPDVAMVADNCIFVSNNGHTNGWWGTSIAAPLWAGFTALVNQQAVAEGKPSVGFLNPALYAIAEGAYYN